jgi:hypothetical protein
MKKDKFILETNHWINAIIIFSICREIWGLMAKQTQRLN